MLATRIIGWISFFFIVGFLIYGFREVFREKAAAKKNLAPPAGHPRNDSGGDSARSP
jgi:hypothetical protein